MDADEISSNTQSNTFIAEFIVLQKVVLTSEQYATYQDYDLKITAKIKEIDSRIIDIINMIGSQGTTNETTNPNFPETFEGSTVLLPFVTITTSNTTKNSTTTTTTTITTTNTTNTASTTTAATTTTSTTTSIELPALVASMETPRIYATTTANTASTTTATTTTNTASTTTATTTATTTTISNTASTNTTTTTTT